MSNHPPTTAFNFEIKDSLFKLWDVAIFPITILDGSEIGIRVVYKSRTNTVWNFLRMYSVYSSEFKEIRLAIKNVLIIISEYIINFFSVPSPKEPNSTESTLDKISEIIQNQIVWNTETNTLELKQ